jgi:hypothetical protein
VSFRNVRVFACEIADKKTERKKGSSE